MIPISAIKEMWGGLEVQNDNKVPWEEAPMGCHKRGELKCASFKWSPITPWLLKLPYTFSLDVKVNPNLTLKQLIK